MATTTTPEIDETSARPSESAPGTSEASTRASGGQRREVLEGTAVAGDGTRLYVRSRRSNDAPARIAILCDGIACDGFIWKYMWDELARYTDVAHWHYRGHGRSARPVDPARIELVDHARDLGATRDYLGDPEVVLIGHSMGCQVALEGFRLRPEKVVGLVLCCGSSGRVTHTFKGTDILARLLPRVIEQVDAHPHLARALWGNLPADAAVRIARFMGEVDDSLRPEDLRPYMTHMVDIDLPMFLRMLASAGEHNAEDLLPEIQIPALVVAGEHDSFTPPQYAERMAEAMPHAELLMTKGTHAAPIEYRDEVHAKLESFFQQLS